MMNRRSLLACLATGAAASLVSTCGMAAPPAPTCWTEVIARLQAAGLNVTSVQNPLTTLPEAVASAQRVLARQNGPTVLEGEQRRARPRFVCRRLASDIPFPG